VISAAIKRNGNGVARGIASPPIQEAIR